MAHEITLPLIRQAQAGQDEALRVFSELARERVYVFIYRLTLDLECTEDLTQDTLVDVLRSLDRLDFSHVNFFWAWLHRTALGKVQHFYRQQGNQRIHSRSRPSSEQLGQMSGKDNPAINQLIKEELRMAVCEAMRALNLAHRSILTLRCFEQLSYPEIASITGQSELQARVQFFRAKQSLKKRLTQKGFSKDQLLAALGLLATVTQGVAKKTSVVTPVHQATLAVSPPIALLGTLASKSGIAAIILVVSGALVGKHSFKGTFRPPALTSVYAQLSNPSRVIKTQAPPGSPWRAYVPPKAPTRITSAVLEANLLRKDRTQDLYIQIPAGYGVHLEYPGPVTDGPGIDILLDARNSNQGPKVWITDGDKQEIELSVTRRQPTGNGFVMTGYDLAGLDIPFVTRSLRLEGCGSLADNTALEIWILKARTQVKR